MPPKATAAGPSSFLERALHSLDSFASGESRAPVRVPAPLPPPPGPAAAGQAFPEPVTLPPAVARPSRRRPLLPPAAAGQAPAASSQARATAGSVSVRTRRGCQLPRRPRPRTPPPPLPIAVSPLPSDHGVHRPVTHCMPPLPLAILLHCRSPPLAVAPHRCPPIAAHLPLVPLDQSKPPPAAASSCTGYSTPRQQLVHFFSRGITPRTEGRFSTRAGGRHPSSTSAPYAKEGRRLSSSAYRRPADHLLSLLVAPKIFNMGKKPGNAGPSSASRPADQAVSLREETSGKMQADVPSLLRIQHLQRLGAWASGEAGVGSIGALLGHRLATNAEAAGIPIGASTFLCQRCESILQPGFNCTIRIRNNKKKAKRHKKSNPGQNSVVYACHFCGDQNLIRGSGKGIVKGLLSSRKTVSTSIMLKGDNINVPTVTTKKGIEHSLTAASQLESSRLKTSTLEKDRQGNGPKSNIHEDSEMEKGVVLSMVDCGQLAAAHEDIPQKIDVEGAHDKCMNGIVPSSCKNITICEPGVTSQAEFLVGSNFVTPMKNKLVEVTAPIGSAEPLKTRSTLKNKVQNCGSVAVKTPGSYSKSVSNTKSAPGDSAQPAGSSRKRSRKGWTTLKQIAEKEELERKEKLDNFVIPFFMQ